jgi:lipid-A-disaccharide synthase
VKYYIIAGERSGDLHGGNLIKALKSYDPAAIFFGFGGDQMHESGLEISVHYKHLAFMGLKEFILNLARILSILKKCKNDILSFKPDVVILIDYGGFNRKIAAFCKKRSVKVFYYIPPKVWAWRQSRAWDLKANVDRLFVILPFEKNFFKEKVNWDVDYVGNPVLDAVKAHKSDASFASNKNLASGRKVIALLPGSRAQELKRIIPVMAEVVKMNPQFQFAVATVSNLDKSLYEAFAGLPNIEYIYEATYDLLKVSQAAIVTSGTATLETALFNVPQVVVYKTSGLNYFVGKRVVKVPFISLVNLIANREVVKELLQETCTPANIGSELNRLVNDNDYRALVIQGNNEVYKILDIGSASDNAARLMHSYLTNS